ncbi:glycosyltransferase family 2 protein [Mycobacterium sp. Y57]|uniref:dolichyl-phosphate beta-glucosyltransferase n=1 Tax=Mycolicibacterium xanthum TaxID=2796469 RepID=UPI001C85B6D4|nr:dolichyl-phosphate beta-glucosyltransferase [Mycolicibacterium xanthum]MBX7433107.1 glycosyltransferase family 2 protein [Mycolicibacterium xanthum]
MVVPAYDESDRIVPTIGAISAHLCSSGLTWELIVSDDGSGDGTAELVRSLNLANVTVLEPGINRGKGAAVRDGVRAARGRYVLFSDADMSTPIEEFDRLLDAIRNGAGVAVASRAADGAEERGRGRRRSLISAALRGGVRKATGVRIKDTQCGFKLFTRESAEALFGSSRVDGFSFDLEILWLAQRWDIAVNEIPVHWIEAPGSKVSPGRESLRFLRDVAVLRYRALRGHYAAAMIATAAA